MVKELVNHFPAGTRTYRAHNNLAIFQLCAELRRPNAMRAQKVATAVETLIENHDRNQELVHTTGLRLRESAYNRSVEHFFVDASSIIHNAHRYSPAWTIKPSTARHVIR